MSEPPDSDLEPSFPFRCDNSIASTSFPRMLGQFSSMPMDDVAAKRYSGSSVMMDGDPSARRLPATGGSLLPPWRVAWNNKIPVYQEYQEISVPYETDLSLVRPVLVSEARNRIDEGSDVPTAGPYQTASETYEVARASEFESTSSQLIEEYIRPRSNSTASESSFSDSSAADIVQPSIPCALPCVSKFHELVHRSQLWNAWLP